MTMKAQIEAIAVQAFAAGMNDVGNKLNEAAALCDGYSAASTIDTLANITAGNAEGQQACNRLRALVL